LLFLSACFVWHILVFEKGSVFTHHAKSALTELQGLAKLFLFLMFFPFVGQELVTAPLKSLLGWIL
jgi:hypothetical protein